MWLLIDLAYWIAAVAALPVWLPYVVLREKYRTRFWERFGGVIPRNGDKPAIWVHAVSVGEVKAAVPLVSDLQRRLPSHDIVISTTTKSGHQTAQQSFPHLHTVQFPLDFSWAVARLLRRIRPSLLVLIELEVWPNLMLMCSAFRVPVIVANGRMTDRSCQRYRRFRWLVGWMFARLTAVLVQTPTYAERFTQAGVSAMKLRVVGSVKYDAVNLDGPALTAKRHEWRRRLNVAESDLLWVAGSTHPPEHEVVVRCWQALRAEGMPLRLVLVPRHPDKPEPLKYLAAQAVPVVRQSELAAKTPAADAVVFGDGIGTLAQMYAAADLAFVGKSLIPHGGGQNPLEPAGLGVPTVVGPSMENFEEPMEDLRRNGGIAQVADEGQLLALVRSWCSAPSARLDIGRNGAATVAAGKGAAARSAEFIAAFLGKP